MYGNKPHFKDKCISVYCDEILIARLILAYTQAIKCVFSSKVKALICRL
jgi:hypothetical protein